MMHGRINFTEIFMGMSFPRHRSESCSKRIDIEFVDEAIVAVAAEQSMRMRVLRDNKKLLERFKVCFESVSNTGIEVGAWTRNIIFRPGEDCVEFTWPLYISPSTVSGIYQFTFVLETDSDRNRLVKQLILLQRPLRQGFLPRRTRQVCLFSMMGFLAAAPADPTHH
jgi:hypothetical protein